MGTLHTDEVLAISRYTGFASMIISSGCVVLSAFITLTESKLNRDRKVKSCIYYSFTLSLLPSPHTGCFAVSALHASSAPYKLWKPPPQKSEALCKAIGFGYPKCVPGAFLILLLPPVYIPAHFSFSMGKKEILAGNKGPFKYFLIPAC